MGSHCQENFLTHPTGHPLERLATPKNGRVQNFGEYMDGKIWTLLFFGGGKSWT